MQTTFAIKAPNGGSHNELGWGRSHQGGHSKPPVFPKGDALERGWMRGQAVVSALGTGNGEPEGSTVLPNLMQGARGKLKEQLRLLMSGPQPQKNSFWCDEWGESTAHVLYQLSLSGTE